MTTQQIDLISKIEAMVADHHAADTTGHDFYHIQRVYKLATYLQSKEGGDLFLIQAASLMHDYADFKLTDDIEHAHATLRQTLTDFGIDRTMINQLFEIITQVSFKGANVDTTPDSLEAQIVQDADRIDALGAIGIARTFAFGGAKDSPIHVPDQPPVQHASFEHYKSSRSSSINHFHEKLLLLKDRINTPTAKHIAQQRHDFMLAYLDQFNAEWDYEGAL